MTSIGLKTSGITVIIPTLDEESNLAALLPRLQRTPGLEIIVVDGGSSDGTTACATRHGATVVTTMPGRGRQLARGAALASRETLLFLHADTLPPADFAGQIHAVLALPHTAAGAFRLGIAGRGFGYRCIEWGANLRTRLLQLPYGDQAIFVQTGLLDRAGGIPDQPILEDLSLIRRLKPFGRIRIAQTKVTTSARRWQRLGPFRTTLLNQLVLAGFACGLSPETLHRFYQGCRK